MANRADTIVQLLKRLQDDPRALDHLSHHEVLGVSPRERDPQVLEQAYLKVYAEARKYQVGRYSRGCVRYLNRLAQVYGWLIDSREPVATDGLAAKVAHRKPSAKPVLPRPELREPRVRQQRVSRRSLTSLASGAGLACVLLLAWFSWPRQTLMCIQTDPPGATIRANTQRLGITPLDVSVRRGRSVLIAELDGYLPARETLQVTGKTKVVSLTLKPKPARCTVVTQPTTARLTLLGGGANISGTGQERAIEFDVPDGRRAYRIRASLAGHADLEQEIRPLPGQHATITFTFPAVYTVAVKPREAQITVVGTGVDIFGSGENRSIVFNHPDSLRSFRLVASLEGHVDLEQQLIPVPGEQRNVSLTFPAIYRLEVNPAEAQISASGPGTTIDKGSGTTLTIADPSMPGPWQIAAKMDGYVDLDRQLTPRPGAKGNLTLILQPCIPPTAIAPFTASEAKAHQQSWAEHLGIPVESTNSIGMEFVLIPPGEFLMGSPDSDQVAQLTEKPAHRVRIAQPFYLGSSEVTQGEWEKVMGSRSKPWSWNFYVKDKEALDFPATFLSREEARVFCDRLSEQDGIRYRLPTEGEWEYACRAGTETRYSFGSNASDLGEYAWYQNNTTNKGDKRVHRVKQKKPNPWGLYDMHGNVWEWCADFLGKYTTDDLVDPRGDDSDQLRVWRGGSWDRSDGYCRSAFRYITRSRRDRGLGFRIAAVAEKGQGPAREAKPTGPRKPSLATAPFDAAEAKRHQDYWAEATGVEAMATNSIGMRLALIPAGEFMMGSPDSDRQAEDEETPQHRVRITKAFYLSIQEVTRGEWKRVMNTRPWSVSTKSQEGPDYPATYVSWQDAKLFCQRLSALPEERETGRAYRLPREAEWEYACRAGSLTVFCCGDDESRLGDYAWYCKNSEGKIHVVRRKEPNAWGLYDMHGNAKEWCEDAYGHHYYRQSPTNDPTGPLASKYRIRRGGCSASNSQSCRSANRDAILQSYREQGQGLRVVAILSSNQGPGREVTLAVREPEPVRTGKSEATKASARKADAAPPTPSKPLLVVPPLLGPDQAKAEQRRWAERSNLPVEQTNSIGMKLVLIPPRELIKRSVDNTGAGNSGEREQVTKLLYLGVSEVTQAEYERVMKVNPSRFKGDGRLPVEGVSWDDANEFCRKLSALPQEQRARRSYRLATAAEWRHACAANSERWIHHHPVDEAKLGKCAWYESNSNGRTHAVCEKKPNAWGLYDMYGNVWEWCGDHYTTPARSGSSGAVQDSARASLIGGSWHHPANRCGGVAGFRVSSRLPMVGFRVATVPFGE